MPRHTLSLLLLLLAGCSSSMNNAVGQREAASFNLVCPSVLGDLTTTLTYAVTENVDPVAPGGALRFVIAAPLAKVKSPVKAQFVSSRVTFDLPAGLELTRVDVEAKSTADFSAISAFSTATQVGVELRGDFPIDDTERPVPGLIVEGIARGAVGTQVVWRPPTAIHGVASVRLLGEEASDCRIQEPGPISTTSIEEG